MTNIKTVQWTYNVYTTPSSPPPLVMDIFVCSKVVEFIMYNYHYDLLISYLMFCWLYFLRMDQTKFYTMICMNLFSNFWFSCLC